MISQTVLRSSLWLAMGTWVGSWAFFAFVVSRIAFQVLPGDIAGDLAGSLLTILHFGGAAAALVVAGAAIGLGRRGLVVGLPVLLALACLASELWLSPEVAAVRPSTLGAASTAESQQRFRTLHGLSLGLFMTIHLASVVLLGLLARLDARELGDAREAAD
jgi:hypothetical protein